MALPVILVDSATGSDTQASGAGPSTALFGTTDASTDGAGTTVTLTAGTDLSGVSTIGDHVIFLNDTTAGARNFSKITGSAGSGGATPTVTVANAFGLSLTTKSWAIGGKRASIGSTTSEKLFDNNSAAGDAMPGWIVEMASGHSETIAATFDCRRSGDTTDGSIILRGVSGAATLPLLTFSNNGNALVARGQCIRLEDFELRNSNATKTASVAMITGSAGPFSCRGLRIDHATNKFWKAWVATSSTNPGGNIESCLIGNCASHGIDSSSLLYVDNSVIYSCGGNGILGPAGSGLHMTVQNCILYNNTGDGINWAPGGTNRTGSSRIVNNVFANNGGDGLDIGGSSVSILDVSNNIFFTNGGYGINSNQTAIFMNASRWRFRGNVFNTNTSGKYNPSDLVSEDEQTTAPSFTNASGLDFSIGSALKGLGFPVGGTLPVGTHSSTYSYVDPGAAQRQEPTGGAGGLIINPGMSGGLRG